MPDDEDHTSPRKAAALAAAAILLVIFASVQAEASPTAHAAAPAVSAEAFAQLPAAVAYDNGNDDGTPVRKNSVRMRAAAPASARRMAGAVNGRKPAVRHSATYLTANPGLRWDCSVLCTYRI